MFALMEWMFQLARPGTVSPDLLTWPRCQAASGELPQPFCVGTSFPSLSPLSQPPACHTHAGRALSLADDGESWDTGHTGAGRGNMEE